MKTPKKKPEILRETIQADYHFTDPEKQDLGHQLAGLLTRREEILDEKKNLVKQYAAREGEISAQISGLSNKITSGVEARPFNALVEFDVKAGKKRFLTDDKKKSLIREEPMSPSDYQLPMFRNEDVNGRKPPGAPLSQETQTPAEPPKKQGKAPKTSPAGETSFADALDKAAGGIPLPKIGFMANDISTADSARFLKEFRRAAKAAEWPEAAINMMRDVLRACDSMSAMQETLNPRIADQPAA